MAKKLQQKKPKKKTVKKTKKVFTYDQRADLKQVLLEIERNVTDALYVA